MLAKKKANNHLSAKGLNMKVTLDIEPHQDGPETSNSNIKAYHVECDNEEVTLKKDRISDDYILKCNNCGFEVLLKEGAGCNDMIITSINGEPRTINSDSFFSETVDEIIVMCSRL
jgi:hypothetical protein